MRLFILGGTGFIGREVVKEAVKQGWDVQTLVRSEESGKRAVALGAEAIPGDLLHPETWLERVRGATALLDLVQPSLPRRIGLRDIQRIATERLAVTEALLDGLERIPAADRPILISVSGTDDLEPAPDRRIEVGSSLAQNPRGFAHIGVPIRRAIERAGLDAVYIYLGTVYGPGKMFAERIVPGLASGRFPIVGSGKSHLPLVHVMDAARALVHVAGLDRRGSSGRTFLVSDGGDVTLGELLEGVANELGAPRPRHVPAWLARAVSGRIAVETLTRDVRCEPSALTQTGFRFQFPSWRAGVAETLRSMGRSSAPASPRAAGLLDRLARPLPVLLLFVAVVAMMLFVNLWAPFSVRRIAEVSGGAVPLDMRPVFGAGAVASRLEALGPEGRSLYRRLLLEFDFAFPLVAALFAVVARRWERGGRLPRLKSWDKVALVPAAAAIADLLENLCSLSALHAYPGTSPLAGAIGALTLTKFLLYGATVVILAVGLRRFPSRDSTTSDVAPDRSIG